MASPPMSPKFTSATTRSLRQKDVVAEPSEVEDVGQVGKDLVAEERRAWMEATPGQIVRRRRGEIGMQIGGELSEAAFDASLVVGIHHGFALLACSIGCSSNVSLGKRSLVRGSLGGALVAPAYAVKAQSFEPPSTWTISPVTQRASSDAGKATTPPISSGCAKRLNACMPSAKSRPASVLVKLDISVSTTPSATALTRIPRPPSSEAKCFTSVSMAPLVAA
jgi:hypothetical protein